MARGFFVGAVGGVVASNLYQIGKTIDEKRPQWASARSHERGYSLRQVAGACPRHGRRGRARRAPRDGQHPGPFTFKGTISYIIAKGTSPSSIPAPTIRRISARCSTPCATRR